MVAYARLLYPKFTSHITRDATPLAAPAEEEESDKSDASLSASEGGWLSGADISLLADSLFDGGADNRPPFPGVREGLRAAIGAAMHAADPTRGGEGG